MKRIVSLMLVLSFLFGSMSSPVFASTTDNMEFEQQNMSNISVTKDNVTVTVQQEEPIKDNVFVDIPIKDSASSRNDSVIKQDIVGSGYEDFYATMTTSLTYMDDKTAESFIGFIYNVKTNNVNNEMKSTNDLFNYLTGRLAKGTEEYDYAQLAFVLTASKLINYHASSSEKMVEISSENLISLLSKKAGGMGNLADEVVNQELGKIKTYVKKILGCIAETDDLIFYIDSAMSVYDTVTGIPGKVEAFLDGLDIAVNACNYVFASNNMKAYNYYLTYLNHRDLETGFTAYLGILPLIMDTYTIGNISDFDGVSIFLQSLGFGNSWTSGDVQRYLRIFAEFTYHSTEEINTVASGGGYVEPETEVTSVSFPSDTYEFNTNQIQHTYALAYPSFAIDKYLTFYSSNTSVATVTSSDGVTCEITSVAPGTCYIYAEASNGVTGKCKVTIVPVLVEKIEFAENENEIFFNQSIKNPAQIYPAYAYDKTFKYYSGDTSIATIDIDGKVTAISPGDVIIYAKASNGIVGSYKLKIHPFTASTNNDGTYNIVKYVGKGKTTVIPAKVHSIPITSIGNNAFSYCKSLVSVTIPDSIERMEKNAFVDCTSLTRVDITDVAAWCGISFNSWYSNPLYYAKNLYFNGELVTNLVIPDFVTSIGYVAFSGCTSIISVTIPDSVTSIGNSAFYYCKSLTSVTIPNSVTSIGDRVFCGCTSLTSVTIPDSVISIGGYAFYSCTSLISVHIGDSVISIDDCAFTNCTSLASVIISNSVTRIGEDAFSNCSSLTNVTIPDSVTSISDFVFSGCTSLVSVNIGNFVTSIGNYAFSDCTSLTSVTIPDSVTSIGYMAFYGCISLTKVVIGSSVKNIAYGVFENCTSLTSVTIDNNNPYYASLNGVLYDKNLTTLIQYPVGNSRTTFSIPNFVTNIGSYAFYKCSLTSVIIPDSVTSISDYAFADCTSLTTVIIPDSVISIGNYAFSDCTSLTSVIISDSVTSISDYAFADCTSLTSVTIPDSVISIGNNAFYYCKSLTSVTIPDSVTSIGEHTFSECIFLESVIIGNSVTSIGDYSFSGCRSLISVIIPDSVTSIGNYTFYYCTSLTSVTIPDSVTSIGRYAFHYYNYEYKPLSITISCYENSCAHSYAVNDGFMYELICDHVFTNYIFDNNATCNNDGTKTAYCDMGCGTFDTAIAIGSATGHSWTNWIESIFPTTTTTGKETRVCTLCGETETRDIPMLTAIPEVSVNNYVVTITNSEYIKDIRYVLGEYTTTTEIRNAEGNVALDNGIVVKNTVDGKFVYEMPDGGVYSFWVRMTDGTNYIETVDMTQMQQEVISNGVTITIKNLYGVKDFFIAEGDYDTYAELKANYIFNATSAKIGTKHDYTYTVKNPGVHTVLIRYKDTARANEFIKINLTVDEPVFTTNGLQVTIGNIPDVKVIRTAYGEYYTPGDTKRAEGSRNFSNKSVIKNAEEYTIQYREEGIVTITVEYNNGYVKVFHYDVQKKSPTVEQNGNMVSLGNLDGLYVIRYAEGEYTTPKQIKNAPGNRVIKSEDILDGYVTVTLNPGIYTFYVQYDDESYNYYNIVVE